MSIYRLFCIAVFFVASPAFAEEASDKCHFENEVWIQEANGGDGACIKAGDAYVAEDGRIVQAGSARQSDGLAPDQVRIQITEGSVDVDCGKNAVFSQSKGTCIPIGSIQKAPPVEEDPDEVGDTTVQEIETTAVACKVGETDSEVFETCVGNDTNLNLAKEESVKTEAGVPGMQTAELAELSAEEFTAPAGMIAIRDILEKASLGQGDQHSPS
ncbi:MAG: hypothetical protein AAF202_09010, partial [Pseudomonadota bacterium]